MRVEVDEKKFAKVKKKYNILKNIRYENGVFNFLDGERFNILMKETVIKIFYN